MISKLLIIVLIGYYILLAFWMLLGFGRSTGSVYMYNLEPFSTIKHFMNFTNFNKDVWMINLVGNIGVFVPFGLLIPMTFRFLYIKSFVVFFIGLTILELSQLITKRGSFDIDDFILNSVGFTIGYILFKILIKIYKNRGN